MLYYNIIDYFFRQLLSYRMLRYDMTVEYFYKFKEKYESIKLQ